MTYNVFGGTLSLTQSINQQDKLNALTELIESKTNITKDFENA